MDRFNFQPSLCRQGDANKDETYAGVGRVLSSWESVEFELSRLLAALMEEPDDPRVLQFYGTGRILQNRLDWVRIAADHHFMTSPNQNHEGDFDLLMEDLSSAADRRNEVAHGVVYEISTSKNLTKHMDPIPDGQDAHVLMPPFYSFRRFEGDTPTFMYARSDLKKLSVQILNLQMRIRPFRHRLYPDKWPTERRGR